MLSSEYKNYCITLYLIINMFQMTCEREREYSEIQLLRASLGYCTGHSVIDDYSLYCSWESVGQLRVPCTLP